LRFYRTFIDGVRFEGALTSLGPTIRSGDRGVVLGNCTSINLLGPNPEIDKWETRWAIAKHHSIECIDLSELSVDGRKRLSEAFGITIQNPSFEFDQKTFYGALAFQGLCDWAREHPRVYKDAQWDRGDHLPDWHQRVKGALPTASRPFGWHDFAFIFGSWTRFVIFHLLLLRDR
jgi:hypothetical protein